MAIDRTTLRGVQVRLEPLAEAHLPGLAAAIEDGALWELPVTSVPAPSELLQFLSLADAQYLAGRELAFATIDEATGTVVGSTRFRNIEMAHKRLEIGSTFVAASWQRTHINTEAKFLMLRHAFEVLQFNRVELLTDFLNAKSRAAIARLGAKEEGVLRSHMVMRAGRVRDSVIFSIVASEWPAVRTSLAARIGAR